MLRRSQKSSREKKNERSTIAIECCRQRQTHKASAILNCMNMCGYQFVAIYDDGIDDIRAGNQKRRNMSCLWLLTDSHIDSDALHPPRTSRSIAPPLVLGQALIGVFYCEHFFRLSFFIIVFNVSLLFHFRSTDLMGTASSAKFFYTLASVISARRMS